MAVSNESVTWRDSLNRHRICKTLKEKNSKESCGKFQNESKNIVCVYGSDLYVWDISDSQLLHCNLKTVGLANEHSPSISNLEESGYQEECGYQKLLLSGVITLDVDNVSANKCGSHLALWSSKNIQVIELPQRWGKNATFQGGKGAIMCRTIFIGERTFGGCHSVRIRQVSWHPGSKTDSHLAVLSTDNIFSVYNIFDPDEPVSKINTGDDVSSFSASKSLISSALGEMCVAFDFGLSFSLKPRQRPFQLSSDVLSDSLEVWPVYCVRGNGDIMLLYSHLSLFKQVTLPVQGPIKMYPPAEDNYGVDACSILCLPTPLPVIVVSTCEGRVHHCVQMPQSVEDESLQADSSFVTTPTSPFDVIPVPVLFVIEIAELELCLSTARLDAQIEEDEEDFICPVKLKKDPCSEDRYHCSHSAGVHSVALPWLSTIQQFFQDEVSDINLSEENQCVVEHLVCTKPLYSCPHAPVLGMDIVTDLMLGPTLLILASDYQFTALPIGLQYRTCFASSHDMSDNNPPTGLRLRNSREPFSQKIAQLLQKKASFPLLKSGSEADLSQQECFQLLGRATQVLREEYIHHQDHARQEIDTRIKVLQGHKERQLHDLKLLIDSKLSLTEHARSVAEKLEATKERHESLIGRLEKILHRIHCRYPVLSDAEKRMARELAKINDNMQLYDQNIKQLRLKFRYQEKKLNKSGQERSVVPLKEKQLSQIMRILKEETAEIQELKRDVSRLSIEIC